MDTMKETAAAPSVTRRHLLLGTAAVIAVSAPEPPGGADVPMAELMAPPPLGDESLGSANAPVTIIEYASMTCPHCAHFHEATFPELKKKYIDTGKVRFIMREFPLDPLAAAGFMLARCSAQEPVKEPAKSPQESDNSAKAPDGAPSPQSAGRYHAMVETLFA